MKVSSAFEAKETARFGEISHPVQDEDSQNKNQLKLDIKSEVLSNSKRSKNQVEDSETWTYEKAWNENLNPNMGSNLTSQNKEFTFSPNQYLNKLLPMKDEQTGKCSERDNLIEYPGQIEMKNKIPIFKTKAPEDLGTSSDQSRFSFSFKRKSKFPQGGKLKVKIRRISKREEKHSEDLIEVNDEACANEVKCTKISIPHI